MRHNAGLIAATLALAVALGVSGTRAEAALATALQSCQKSITTSAQKYLRAVIKLDQKCNNANLKAPGSCSGPDTGKSSKAEEKLRGKIAAKCGSLSTGQIENENPNGLAFPGSCPDPDGGDFSVTNIEDCMLLRHGDKVADLVADEYGSTTGPLANGPARCQSALAKAAAKFVSRKLKCIETKCRSQIDKARLTLNPADCETEPATAACIEKALAKFESGISKKCIDSDIALLDVCSPAATTVAEAQQCLNQTHGEAANYLINVEHPAPPSCGDDAVNQPTEECDGTDDSACPGQCGASDSFFPCLCLNVPRVFNRYDQDADLETGWTGEAHDGKVVDGGGYFAAVSHCGELGPDICLTGPACLITPQHCRDDADCPGGDSCVATQARTLPHCADNAQEPCRICGGGARDGQLCLVGDDCPSGTCLACTSGAACVLSFEGFPLPIAGGGSSVCVFNTFVEDVFGTMNLATGESNEFLRENSKTFLSKSVPMPCPVCGGFCAGSGGLAALCQADSDCPPGDTCVLSHVCNDGPNKGKPCSPEPPRGGVIAGFGHTSFDCPPSPGQNISGSGLDIAYDPYVTGVITVAASVTCTNFKICTGNQSTCTTDGNCPPGQVCKSICSGSLEPCAGDSDCPGAETCNQRCSGSRDQCLDESACPSGQVCAAPIRCFIAGQRVPNACNPACVGGPDDGIQCVTGSDCSSGECRPAECRLNPGDPNNPPPKQCRVSGGSCTETALCPTRCSAAAGGALCTTDAECANHCSLTGAFCGADPDCPNQCSVSASPCGNDTDCSMGETCLFETCIIETCQHEICDALTPTEGVCIAGPAFGECSLEKFRTCFADADCQRPPGGDCPTCQAGQVCKLGNRQCFTNPIVRRGVAGPTQSTKVTIFPIAGTSSSAINTSSGLPGPGATAQPARLVFTP